MPAARYLAVGAGAADEGQAAVFGPFIVVEDDPGAPAAARLRALLAVHDDPRRPARVRHDHTERPIVLAPIVPLAVALYEHGLARLRNGARLTGAAEGENGGAPASIV